MRATAAVDPGTRAEARRPFRSLDPPPENAVHLRGVSRLYDGVPAVAHLRLAIDVGETIWLRGPNGSGKSTVLRLLATVVSPTFGTGSVLGHDLVVGRADVLLLETGTTLPVQHVQLNTRRGLTRRVQLYRDRDESK